MPDKAPPDAPKELTGGCLCGAIRYTVNTSDPDLWPKGSTCQCTTCRKWTSALISHALMITTKQLSDIRSAETYREYKSGDDSQRAFCSKCGSSLTWTSESMPDTIILMAGTIDEKWLVGEKVEGTEKETKGGKAFERKGGFGKLLVEPQKNMFWETAIEGITDHHLGGQRFLQEPGEYEGF